ncbi:hypothetical protein ES703_70132 [subsurface metagenome]
MGEKQGERFIQVLFIGLLVAAIFLPAKYTFMGFVGLVALYLVIGFVSTARFDEISKVLGIYLALIVLIEGGHAGAALACGVPMKGGNVTLLGVADGVGVGPSGWVELDIEKADVDASPELMSKVSWISAAGSIILVVFGALYFVLRSKDKFPAIVATLLFFLHQAPFLWNDQAMCISNGWMSSTFAYAIFIGGLIVLGITFRFRRGEKKTVRVGGRV